MEYALLINKAIDFMKEKHIDQLDKSDRPYYTHCLKVRDSFQIRYFDLEDDEFWLGQVVSLLHDTCEDTETTYDELVENFGQSVADHVNMLTRREDMSYMGYINSLKHNEVCRKVKIADLLHNMDLTRLNKITKKDIERNRKYLKALEVLIEMEE